LENRLNEMIAMESERRESLNSFLDSQALREVERDRVWKEWQNRFQSVEAQSAELENMLQSLDNTNRTVKRSQQSVEELIQKVERNISEISEIQRLNEERFRQEWVTFRADDQKRWTNYTLTIEEQHGETQNQLTRQSDRLTHLEDLMQELQDMASLANDHTEKRLQAILSMAHEWVSTFERTVGRNR
jgi:vacuolar-type H+-ATPase subunit I/STV1